jgi:hypothetical protein
MKRTAAFLFVAFLWVLAGSASAQNYVSLADAETTATGVHVTAYHHGDTLYGGIRSNGAIRIEGDPVFYGPVTLSAAAFDQGPDYAPQFLGSAPVFNAPTVELDELARNVRAGALIQEHCYPWFDRTIRASFRGTYIRMYMWPTGTPVDSSDSWDVTIPWGVCVYSEGPVEIRGHLSGQVTICSAQKISIIDDVVYDDSDLGTGVIPPAVIETSRNFLGIVSEGDVRIANTPANGRENSDTLGFDQTDRDYASVVICGSVVAQGSFTFEQQNDADSGYVCECEPDDRGTVYLFGSVSQARRGYLHRSTNQSTGYRQVFRADPRSCYQVPPCFHEPAQRPHCTDSVNFGDVPVGTTAIDTAEVVIVSCNGEAGELLGVRPTWPFVAEGIPPLTGDHFSISVRFAPPRIGLFSGNLDVTTSTNFFQIHLRGRGATLSSAGDPIIVPHSSLIVSAYPNPFNPTTLIRFCLPEAGHVSLKVFDLHGRLVKTLVDETLPAGEQRIAFDGDNLPSGLYFAQLQTSRHCVTAKLLLVK